jgi:hypothetical protein
MNQLALRGEEDAWFTARPDITYFETTPAKTQNKKKVSFEIPFDSIGPTGVCTLPQYGDYLTGLTLRVTLPPIFPIQSSAYVFPGVSNSRLFVQLSATSIVTVTGYAGQPNSLCIITASPHGFSVGATVYITQTGTVLDGNSYSISLIQSTTQFLAPYPNAISPPVSGLIGAAGIIPTPITDGAYYSTVNFNLWGQIAASQLSVINTSLQYVYSSSSYSNIYFLDSASAAFWGFDSRQGLVYPFVNGTIVPPWSFSQSGWIPGFLPPDLSTYDDSVGNKLIHAARLLIGKQLINEFTGEYIELYNDLTVPYENKAILKLLNGTLDQTQATTYRQYYISLPLGIKRIPLASMFRQQTSIEIDFENYTNLSQNFNAGSGIFTDPLSYTVYPNNVTIQATLSYQQYLFFITTSGNIIVYDSTQEFNAPGALTTIAQQSLTGFNTYSQFIAFNGIYIQTVQGPLYLFQISDILNGSSKNISNNYYPAPLGPGIPSGTLTSDDTYLYYAQTLNASVYLARYNTGLSFKDPGSYSSFNFTSTIDSAVHGFSQLIYTGQELLIIPSTFTGYIYGTTNFCATTTKYTTPSQFLTGVIIGTFIYFVDTVNQIWAYDTINKVIINSVLLTFPGPQVTSMQGDGNFIYASSSTSVFQMNTLTNTFLKSPLKFTSTQLFAYGPRFVFMVSTASSGPVVQFDPYAVPFQYQYNATLIADYETDDTPAPTSNTLIGIIQTQHIQDMTKMDLRGPVKELWFTGSPASTNVFQYSNVSDTSSIVLTSDEAIVTNDVGSNAFLGILQPFETHTAMPIRNVSVFSMELDPESDVPNGTVNFSRIRDQQFIGGAQSGWARNYNILMVRDGFGGLMFN